MTPTEQAARWLADVKRWTPVSMSETVLFENGTGELVRYDDALAAIARLFAPGGDLVAQATAALEGVTDGPWLFGKTGEEKRLILGGPSRRYVATVTIHQIPRHVGLWEEDEREANARFIAFARDWVPEAAARLSALTAQVAKTQADRDKWFEGAGAHHVASMKQAQRADQAEAEVSRLRDRLARMEGALRVTDEADARFAEWFRKNYPGPDTIIHKPDWHAPKILRAARAALTETPADGGKHE